MTATRLVEHFKILFYLLLGLEQTLIKNFRIILIALSCKFPLNANLFEEYCRSTAEIYVSKYKWYPMPPTVHKILMQIIRNSAFPLGMLGEEASEARNKNYKNFREFHSRKHRKPHWCIKQSIGFVRSHFRQTHQRCVLILEFEKGNDYLYLKQSETCF